ncbi:MAG: helix-turn-helix transcriptional regulator [bacterium]|nr:helix-turn-helix transcriptional regulator [bacterium]
MAITADILRGYTDTIILRQLSHGDSYGYRISKAVAQISQGGLEMKEATLYTAFRRLEQAGMIRSYWGDEQTGARRRYYAVSEEGRQKLAQDCAAWEETKAMLDRLLKEDVE